MGQAKRPVPRTHHHAPLKNTSEPVHGAAPSKTPRKSLIERHRPQHVCIALGGPQGHGDSLRVAAQLRVTEPRPRESGWRNSAEGSFRSPHGRKSGFMLRPHLELQRPRGSRQMQVSSGGIQFQQHVPIGAGAAFPLKRLVTRGRPDFREFKNRSATRQ